MTDRDDELAQYAADQELNLYKEYRDVIGLFQYIVETDRRFYLANSVDLVTHHETGDTYFELLLEDAWVWDVFRSYNAPAFSASAMSISKNFRTGTILTCRQMAPLSRR